MDKTRLDIALLKLNPDLPGANELSHRHHPIVVD